MLKNIFEDSTFVLRILNIGDVKDVLHLQNCAVQELKDRYQPMDKMVIEDALSNQLSVGFFANDVMIGMRLCQMKDNKDLMNTKLVFEKNTNTLFLCGTYLLPAVRGHKLGLKMTKACLDLAKKVGIEHVYTTVSPLNYPNLSNLLSIGFFIIDIGIKYTNKLRYTVYSNIQKKMLLKKSSLIEVKNKDHEIQKDLIQRGYFGVKTIKKNNNLYVCYLKCELS